MSKEFEKKKVLSDIVVKQSDIIYKKVFIFTVIAGGSWLYGVKIDGYLGYIIWFVFILSSIGIVFNPNYAIGFTKVVFMLEFRVFVKNLSLTDK